MPEIKTVEKAKKALREGKQPTTAAGEFVREEMEHKHGARSAPPTERTTGIRQDPTLRAPEARDLETSYDQAQAKDGVAVRLAALHLSRARRRGETLHLSGERHDVRALLLATTNRHITCCTRFCPARSSRIQTG